MVLEKTLESLLERKEIKSLNSKGNQPSIFTGRTYAKAETLMLWSPNANRTDWKRPWCWERLSTGEEGVMEDERVEFGETLGDGEGQGSLACCRLWGYKESDMTVWRNKESCGHCWVFQICWHIECSTLTASSLRIWHSSARISSPLLGFFVVMLLKALLKSHSRLSGSRWMTTPSSLSGS